MTTTMISDLTGYFQYIQQFGNLRTTMHARRWSTAVLRTLGLNLDGKTKKRLAQALPAELAGELNRVFWLLHFRDKSLAQAQFLKDVAKRAGNTDAEFARDPVTAVFHGLKDLVGPGVSQQVADSLAPEISQLWQGS